MSEVAGAALVASAMGGDKCLTAAVLLCNVPSVDTVETPVESKLVLLMGSEKCLNIKFDICMEARLCACST